MEILWQRVSTSAAKRRGAVAPALQATPSLLASFDSQIVRRQRVSAAAGASGIVTIQAPTMSGGAPWPLWARREPPLPTLISFAVVR
jgi:hypothetical protein